MKLKNKTAYFVFTAFALLALPIANVNAALSAIVNSYTGSNSSPGILNITVSGTVDELGTNANHKIFIGLAGVDWINDKHITRGQDANKFTYHINPHNTSGGTIGWVNADTNLEGEDQFSFFFDRDFVVGEEVNFTWSDHVGTDFDGGSYLDFDAIPMPSLRVGHGSLVVPEPSSTLLIGLGGMSLLLRRKRTC